MCCVRIPYVLRRQRARRQHDRPNPHHGPPRGARGNQPQPGEVLTGVTFAVGSRFALRIFINANTDTFAAAGISRKRSARASVIHHRHQGARRALKTRQIACARNPPQPLRQARPMPNQQPCWSYRGPLATQFRPSGRQHHLPARSASERTVVLMMNSFHSHHARVYRCTTCWAIEDQDAITAPSSSASERR